MSESSLQSQIKQALKAEGFVVLDTSVYGSPRVMRQSKMGAASKGLPDLFVSRPEWERGVWVGLEVKTPTGKLKPEQQILADQHRIVIVRSIRDALDAVKGVALTS